MKKLLSNITVIILMLSFAVVLLGCTKITEQNYNRIEVGMDEGQVNLILGPPTKSDSVNFFGANATTSVWNTQNTEITILFINHKVVIKGLKANGNKNQLQMPNLNLNLTNS